MTKTKICGITNFVDGSLAAQLGAWAIGFVFYPNSPRYILPENAAQITRQLANYPVKTIGVFVNETPERINSIAAKVRLDYVQLHGTEPEIACRKIERPYIKNIRSIEELADYSGAFAYLIDAHDTENWGGTGKLADWQLAKQIKSQSKPLMLSGGLSTENIAVAIDQIRPDFLDISSSIETKPGEKNHHLMRQLFAKLKEK